MNGGPQHEPMPHAASLAAWDIPAAVVAGEHFAVKVGAKSQIGCGLGGCAIEVVDEAGVVLARGLLGAATWPGTDALFWSEVELCAPSAPGVARLALRFEPAALEAPHGSAASSFSIAVVAAPEHVLTVTVTDAGRPLPEATVRAGAVRVATDAAGRARLHLAKGRYDLVVWKMGHEMPVTPIEVVADMAVIVDAPAQPADDPDAVWTA